MLAYSLYLSVLIVLLICEATTVSSFEIMEFPLVFFLSNSNFVQNIEWKMGHACLKHFSCHCSWCCVKGLVKTMCVILNYSIFFFIHSDLAMLWLVFYFVMLILMFCTFVVETMVCIRNFNLRYFEGFTALLCMHW